jgi:hypothetical protein
MGIIGHLNITLWPTDTSSGIEIALQLTEVTL